jgi:hypothetical protein
MKLRRQGIVMNLKEPRRLYRDNRLQQRRRGGRNRRSPFGWRVQPSPRSRRQSLCNPSRIHHHSSRLFDKLGVVQGPSDEKSKIMLDARFGSGSKCIGLSLLQR